MKTAAILALLFAAAPAFAAEPLDCDKVGDQASDMIARRASGLTEREALAELSARGDYRLGFLVDGVFGAKPGASPAMTRAEIVQKCKHVNKTGTTY